jgi:cysteine synthase A
MQRAGRQGSVVTLICDSAERYLKSDYDRRWLHERGHNLEPYLAQLEHFYRHGEWSNDLG